MIDAVEQDEPPVAEEAACDCDPCKKKRGGPNNIHSSVIHSYTSRPPRGWEPRRTAAEIRNGVSAPLFGIELETSVSAEDIPPLPDRPPNPRDHIWSPATPDNAQSNAERVIEHVALGVWQDANFLYLESLHGLRADEAVSLAAPRGLWHAKHDGSVSGPEFASHPATLAYWRSQRPKLTGMMKSLLHGGMRSHNSGTCGLHINISNDAFRNSEHLYRFASLIVENEDWATRLAQRTPEQRDSWAPFRGLLDSEERRLWAGRVATRGYASQNRYCVLNASNMGRLEFRLPRGTLRMDRFYAKLEWTAAMVEYTRAADSVVNPYDFEQWVHVSGEYPAFASFLHEMGRGER